MRRATLAMLGLLLGLGLICAEACSGGDGDGDADADTDADSDDDADIDADTDIDVDSDVDGDTDADSDVDGDVDGDGDGDADGPPDWASCVVPSDCVLRANSCCGVCGAPERGDVDAVNAAMTDEHFAEVCPTMPPEGCPDCPSAENPWLVATCATAVCLAVDLRDEALTECALASDCRLRVTDCCECGADTSPYRLIAVNSSRVSDLEALVCDPDSGCFDCVPEYPEGYEAACDDDGHCSVNDL